MPFSSCCGWSPQCTSTTWRERRVTLAAVQSRRPIAPLTRPAHGSAIPRHAWLQPNIHAGSRPVLPELPPELNCHGTMRPPLPASRVERRVLRWLLAVAASAALALIAYSAWTRVGECVAACRASGAPDGRLRFNADGHLNLGTHCECIGVASPAVSRQATPQSEIRGDFGRCSCSGSGRAAQGANARFGLGMAVEVFRHVDALAAMR